MGFFKSQKNVVTEARFTFFELVEVPNAGDSFYRIEILVRDVSTGALEAPDGNRFYLRLIRDDGNVAAWDGRLYSDAAGAVALNASTHVAFPTGDKWYQIETMIQPGLFEAWIKVSNGDPTASLKLEGGWFEAGVPGRIAQDVDITSSGGAAILAAVQALQIDVGDVSANANLQSLKAYFGSLLDDVNVALGHAVLHGFRIFRVTAHAAGSFTIATLAVGSGPFIPTEDDALNGSMFVKLDVAGGYTGTIKRYFNTGVCQLYDAALDIGAGGFVLIPNATEGFIGRSDDAAAVAMGVAGKSLQSVLQLLFNNTGDFTSTGFGSLFGYLGTWPDDVGIDLSKLLFFGLRVYATSASAAGQFTLTALTVNGPFGLIAVDDYFNGSEFMVLTGAQAGYCGKVIDYTAAGVTTLDRAIDVGVGVKIAFFATIGGYIGKSDDTAAASIGLAGKSTFSVLNLIGNRLGGVQTRNNVVNYPVVTPTAVADNDPSELETNASATNSTTSYKVLHIATFNVAGGTDALMQAISFFVKWRSTGTIVAGAGETSTKWAAAPVTNTDSPGDTPSGDVVDITDVFTTASGTNNRSSWVRASALPASRGIKLLLLGKVTTATDIVTCTIFSTSEIEITYVMA
jgi:hypothetical protein